MARGASLSDGPDFQEHDLWVPRTARSGVAAQLLIHERRPFSASRGRQQRALACAYWRVGRLFQLWRGNCVHGPACGIDPRGYRREQRDHGPDPWRVADHVHSMRDPLRDAARPPRGAAHVGHLDADHGGLGAGEVLCGHAVGIVSRRGALWGGRADDLGWCARGNREALRRQGAGDCDGAVCDRALSRRAGGSCDHQLRCDADDRTKLARCDGRLCRACVGKWRALAAGVGPSRGRPWCAEWSQEIQPQRVCRDHCCASGAPDPRDGCGGFLSQPRAEQLAA